MRENILRETAATHVYLNYTRFGTKQVHKLKLYFIDREYAYFASKKLQEDFVPLNKGTPAEILVYTVDGFYKTNVYINSTQQDTNEILFEVSIPKTWEFTQRRNGSRCNISMEVNIKYNDDFEINAITNDIALDGVSFYLKDKINVIYEKLPAIITVKLPSSCWIKNPSCKIYTETQFVRKRIEEDDKEHYQQYLYAYQFMKLSPEEKASLKELLLQRPH